MDADSDGLYDTLRVDFQVDFEQPPTYGLAVDTLPVAHTSQAYRADEFASGVGSIYLPAVSR